MTIRKIVKMMGTGAAIALFSFSAQAALVNAGFETDDASSGDVAGATGWGNGFNASFTASDQFDNGNQAPQAHSGNQMLKQFGPFFNGGAAGLSQDVAASAGDIVDASVWAQSWTGNQPGGTPNPAPLDGIGDFQLLFIDGSGGVISQLDTNFDRVDDGTNITILDDVWTQFSYSSIVAPPGTAAARIQLLHIWIDGAAGSVVWWDDASLTVTAIPVPAAVWLFGSGLVGLIGVARRRKQA